MAARLNLETLKQLQENGAPEGVILPGYDPSNVKASIVHFGPSNFARAHLAKYAQDLIRNGHTDAGIIAVSPVISSGDLAEAFDLATSNNRTIKRQRGLAAQDHLYGVWVNEGGTNEVEIMASIKDVVLGPFNVQKVIDQMASPDTKLVTMTITNDGYYYDGKDGIDWKKAGLDPNSNKPLTNQDPPMTTVQYVVDALEQRMKAGLPSFGLMSLDNFPDNSYRLMKTVLAYSSTRDPKLRDWIKDNTPYYTTMVDRIVPQPTNDVIANVSGRIGLDDSQALATESFMELVVQRGRYDNSERKDRVDPPIPFDQAGALYVDEVKKYADTKLRMLNGAHMALGVVGRLRGKTHADDALKDPALYEFVDSYIQEVAATLPELPGIDKDAYRAKILSRMSNEFIHDELSRLARNGESKIEGRFISPLKIAYERDLPRDYMLYGLASWVKYVASANPDRDTKGDIPETAGHKRTFDIADPVSYERGIVRLAKSLNGDVSPMMSMNIWKDLQENPKFVEEFSAVYKQISGYGQDNGFVVKSSPFTPPEVA